MHVLLTSFSLCRDRSREEMLGKGWKKCLGKVGEAQRGSKGSLTSFQRVSQSLGAMQPCL